MSQLFRGIRRNPYIIVALVAAAAAGLLIQNYLAGFAQTVPVVVASRDLGVPRRLEAGDVQVVPFPRDSIHPMAIHDPSAAAGRVLLSPAVAGEPLLSAHLAPESGEGSALQASLQDGERAFFLPIPLDRALGGALRPGDRVDVIFTRGASRNEEAFARIMLTGVKVIDVRDPSGRSASAGADDGGPVPAGVVVAVSEDDAERLAFALEEGRLYLALAHGPEGPEGDWVWRTPVTGETLFLPSGGFDFGDLDGDPEGFLGPVMPLPGEGDGDAPGDDGGDGP